MKMQRLSVLLVEDDEIDRRAVRRALADRSVEADIVEAHDGQEALDLLAGRSDRALPPRPFIILLDLNMPVVDGISFLRQLRDKEVGLPDRDAIVFVLTTSESDKDVALAYSHSVAGYLVKSDYDTAMSRLVDLLCSYEGAVEFPPAHV